MNKAQEEHLNHIKNHFVQAVDLKYRIGAKEHDGDLLDMTPLQMVDEALLECIDQFTFLSSLRDKLCQE